MRIGFDARWLHVVHPIAYNRYLVNLVRALQIQPGVELFLFEDERKPLCKTHLEGLRAGVITLSASRELTWEQVSLPRALREYRIDVYHAVADRGLPAARVCRYVLTNTSLPNQVYFKHMLETGQLSGTLEDYLGDLRPSHPTLRGVYLRARAGVVRWISFNRPDRIIAISETTKRELAALLGVPERKLRVTPLAPEPRFREAPDQEAVAQVRRRYRLLGRYMLCVSSVARLKNPAGLLRAHAMLRRRGVEVALVFCSQVSYRLEEYRNLARELGLYENRDLFFLDKVPDADLRSLYHGAAVFVLLSWYEAFSFPVVEAMACGTPVIASNTSCLPETVGDGGLLVDPRKTEEVAAAIERVLVDPGLREDLRRRALQRSLAFSWDKTAAKTVQVYEELVGNGRRRPVP